MNAAALFAPRVPVRRPSIESSASLERKSRTLASVIALEAIGADCGGWDVHAAAASTATERRLYRILSNYITGMNTKKTIGVVFVLLAVHSVFIQVKRFPPFSC
jgi:hypothetical protein